MAGAAGARSLIILHTNDHYEVKPRTSDPAGGAARMVYMHDCLRASSGGAGCVLTTFGGDILSPSLLSNTTKGAHMVPILTKMRVDVAVFGNHEFDAGVDNAVVQTSKMPFPWLMSNCYDRTSRDREGNPLPLGDGRLYEVFERNGVRVGVMGLIEPEWLETLSHVDIRNVEFVRFEEQARKLNRLLREEEGCDVVIALTHMRVPNDEALAQQVPELDLILGGHDHSCVLKQVNGVVIAKSGSDFSHITRLELSLPGREATTAGPRPDLPAAVAESVEQEQSFRTQAGLTISAQRFAANASVPECRETAALVVDLTAELEVQLAKIVGVLGYDLDARFNKIRTQETNAGNLVADVMRRAVNAEVALLNSGTLRADRVIAAGPVTAKSLVSLVPRHDIIVKLSVPGQRLLEALEGALSKHPALEGRFPCVSGMSLQFRSGAEEGSRLGTVLIGGQQLERDRNYTVATSVYLAKGKDGYAALASADVTELIGPDRGPTIPNSLRMHFDLLASLNGIRPAVDATSRRHAAELRSQALLRNRTGPRAPADQLRRAADAAVVAVAAFGADGASPGNTAPTAEEELESDGKDDEAHLEPAPMARAPSAPEAVGGNQLGMRLHFHTSPSEVAQLLRMQGYLSKRANRLLAAAGARDIVSLVAERLFGPNHPPGLAANGSADWNRRPAGRPLEVAPAMSSAAAGAGCDIGLSLSPTPTAPKEASASAQEQESIPMMLSAPLPPPPPAVGEATQPAVSELRRRARAARQNAAEGAEVASLLSRRSGAYLVYRAARLLARSPSLCSRATAHSSMLMSDRPFRGEQPDRRRQRGFGQLVEGLRASGQLQDARFEWLRLLAAASEDCAALLLGEDANLPELVKKFMPPVADVPEGFADLESPATPATSQAERDPSAAAAGGDADSPIGALPIPEVDCGLVEVCRSSAGVHSVFLVAARVCAEHPRVVCLDWRDQGDSQ